MSEQDNIRLAHEYTAAMNAHDYERMNSYHGEGFQSRFSGFPEPLEGDAHQAFYEASWTAFPDQTFEIDQVVAQGDCVVLNWTCTGTHNGPLATSPGDAVQPTGRKITLAGSSTMEFKDGKVVRDRAYWDRMTLFADIGAVPEA